MSGKRAFTAFEVLIVIAIIGSLAGIGTVMFRSYLIRSELDLAAQSTLQALRSAQVNSQSGMEDGVWGVHAPTGTIFLGNSYLDRNVTFDQPYRAISALVSVTGPVEEVSFSAIYGEPAVEGVIIFEAINGDRREVPIPVALGGPGTIDFGNDVRMKIDFINIKNQGNGSAEAASYVGTESVRFGDGEWIPIKTGSTSHLDSDLVIGVTGLAIQRNAGSVHITAFGGLESGGKEVVDARITFEGARVTDVQNVAGDHETEHPFDGVVSNGVGGDEVEWTEGSRSVLFQTRVTNYGDTIRIYWEEEPARWIW